MNVITVADYEQMSEKAAQFVAEQVRQRPDMTIGFPTGNTPKGMYARLVQMYKDGAVDFGQLRAFTLDEYWEVEPDHPASFARYIREHFLNHVNVAQERVNMPAGKGDADEEAKKYEQLIAEAGGLDLVILGIGSNAHIGFNEPGTSFAARTGLVKLAEQTRKDALNPGYAFNTAEEVPHYGISMGIATIMEARKILLLASGESKANAIGATVQGPVTEDVPASVLQRHPDVTIIVDEAAGKLLSASKE